MGGSAVTAATEWLALLRVHEGGVTMLGGSFFNQGQPVADFFAVALDELLRTEHAALGTPTPTGQQQVCVTHTGQARYAELNSNGAREARHGD
ncbi:MAG: hypothetical protein ABR608_12615 [Pseudonocardiaceae bacterium]